jgi:hypothetical protein
LLIPPPGNTVPWVYRASCEMNGQSQP